MVDRSIVWTRARRSLSQDQAVWQQVVAGVPEKAGLFRTIPCSTYKALPTPLPDISQVSGCLFTSQLAVEFAQGYMGWQHLLCYCFGARTAQALREAGLEVRFQAAQSARLWLPQLPENRRWLFPCAVRPAVDAAALLQPAGSEVLPWPLYETLPEEIPATEFQSIAPGSVICFAAPSAVEGWIRGVTRAGVKDLCQSWRVCAMGETTKQAAEVCFSQVEIPRESTHAALMRQALALIAA